jgi:hypothetical protein
MIRTYPNGSASANFSSEKPHRRAPLHRRLLQLLQRDPANIRNHLDSGGGALMDIGCYSSTPPATPSAACPPASRPHRPRPRNAHRPPHLRHARLSTGGQSIFTCSTQLVPYQRIHFLRHPRPHRNRNPLQRPTRPPHPPVHRHRRRPLRQNGITTETFPTCDQYTLQGDAFSKPSSKTPKSPSPSKTPSPTWP